jgi:Protein of unknown function (DUF1499)
MKLKAGMRRARLRSQLFDGEHLLHHVAAVMGMQSQLENAQTALPPAAFSIVLALTATLAHRSGLLATPDYILVALLTFLFAIIGALLSFVGLTRVWLYAAKGMKRCAWAFMLSLPVLGTGLLALFMFALTAPLSDISTDTLDPPHFTSPPNSATGANVNEPPRLDRKIQTEFFPYLTGRRYALATDTIVGHVVKQIANNGWLSASENARSLGDGDWIIEANVTTPLFGFMDRVVVRITDEGDATYVDMRSAAEYGRYDLGGNARRIEKFMKDLDHRVSQRAP